jgi:hypothetical protein
MSKSNLYANVRKNGRYGSQRQPEPFEINLHENAFQIMEGYFWNGGIGGNYRTVDLEFYVKEPKSGELVSVSPLDSGAPELVAQVSELALTATNSSYVEALIDELEHALKAAKQKLTNLKVKEAQESELE